MVLRQMQQLLAAIYDLPAGRNIYDFLITDPALLPEGARVGPVDEQLILDDDGAQLGVGLFLDAAVLERLGRDNPIDMLCSRNVQDCLTALEGVSHFAYIEWSARHDRPVTLLELELQAEVDKYVASLWLMRAQQPERFPHELHRLLFQQARVDEDMALERTDLYRQASRWAARFCQHVARQAERPTRSTAAALIAQLRRFYRLTNQRKREFIRREVAVAAG
ncbi:MAG: hypothetical protein R3E77_02950 [Steroidobacteraceae bacterium]